MAGEEPITKLEAFRDSLPYKSFVTNVTASVNNLVNDAISNGLNVQEAAALPHQAVMDILSPLWTGQSADRTSNNRGQQVGEREVGNSSRTTLVRIRAERDTIDLTAADDDNTASPGPSSRPPRGPAASVFRSPVPAIDLDQDTIRANYENALARRANLRRGFVMEMDDESQWDEAESAPADDVSSVNESDPEARDDSPSERRRARVDAATGETLPRRAASSRIARLGSSTILSDPRIDDPRQSNSQAGGFSWSFSALDHPSNDVGSGRPNANRSSANAAVAALARATLTHARPGCPAPASAVPDAIRMASLAVRYGLEDPFDGGSSSTVVPALSSFGNAGATPPVSNKRKSPSNTAEEVKAASLAATNQAKKPKTPTKVEAPPESAVAKQARETRERNRAARRQKKK